MISLEDNEFLCRVPTMQEVYDALYSIPEDSSPGPSKFGLGF